MLRRRIALAAAVAVALLALGAGVVFAQEQQATTQEDGTFVAAGPGQVVHCQRVPCYASGNDDLVYERVGNGKRDDIRLQGGDDQVRADHYGNDQDTIRGSSGFDLIYVNDRDTKDKIFGGKGRDKCYVDAHSEVGSGCSVVIVP